MPPKREFDVEKEKEEFRDMFSTHVAKHKDLKNLEAKLDDVEKKATKEGKRIKEQIKKAKEGIKKQSKLLNAKEKSIKKHGGELTFGVHHWKF